MIVQPNSSTGAHRELVEPRGLGASENLYAQHVSMMAYPVGILAIIRL